MLFLIFVCRFVSDSARRPHVLYSLWLLQNSFYTLASQQCHLICYMWRRKPGKDKIFSVVCLYR